MTIFCVHDADAYGTMIYQTFQEATKARGARKIKIVNLGLEPGDGEAARDLPGRALDPGSVVLDEVAAAVERADVDVRAEVEAIVGKLLEDKAAQPLRRYASLLLEPFDRAEDRPVLVLEFQVLGDR